MGFINNDGQRLALFQGRFCCFAQLLGTYSCDLTIHERILQCPQNRTVILCPLEPVGACSSSKNTGKWDEAGIRHHQFFRLEQELFFEQTDECVLTVSAMIDDALNRTWTSVAC